MRDIRKLIDRPINFKLYAGRNIARDFPKDENGFTNCVVLVCWALEINRLDYPDKFIDLAIERIPHFDKPELNSIIAYPSTTRLRGYTYVPGCCALVSEIRNGQVTKIIGIHPRYGEIIFEGPPDIFENKPVVYLNAGQ